MNALIGEPVDRPPVLAVLGFYGSRLTGTPIKELYHDADKYVAAQQAVIETFGIDMLLAPFDFSLITEAFGGDVAFFDDQAPNMKRPAASSVREALALKPPDPRSTGRLAFMLEVTRKLAALHKGTIPIFSTIPGPSALPALILGMESWMETFLFDEPAAARLLEWSGAFWVSLANALLEAGADALVATEGMAPATVTTRDLFEQKCLPHTRTCYAQVEGPIVFHHNGGPVNHVIDLIPGLPNLMAIAISSRDDPYDARRKVGPGIPLLGNIQGLSFRAVAADQIREQATACFEANEEIGPYILCPDGADLPIDTPPENIHAMREAAEAFAARPENPRDGEPLWIGCGVLRAEIAELHRRGEIEGEIRFLDSMLHMNPPRLGQALREKSAEADRPVVLVYGDCCPDMLQLADAPNTRKVEGINCCQMLTGKARYRELMREEAFMLLPEWTPRWKEIIETELGLRGTVARDLLKDTRKILVYIDTGLVPVPRKTLAECAAYTGLPTRIERTELDHLRDALNEARGMTQGRLNK